MTLKFPEDKKFDERVKKFREFLESRGFGFEQRQNQLFLARKKGIVVNVYNNGKIVFGGKSKEEIEEIKNLAKSIGAEEEGQTKLIKGKRIGTDEVGKGDYFGPLIIAGVIISEEVERELESMGVKDSKRLSDTRIRDLGYEIRRVLDRKNYDILFISPLRYNLLYNRLRNVNRILGWAHARVIENLLEANECQAAISDQFGDPGYIKNALMEKGRRIELYQTPHAERDLAVAAASILAREEFISKMEELSEIYQFDFPKGSSNVDEKAKEFVEIYGVDALKNVAKIHFSNTSRIIGRELKLDRIEEFEREIKRNKSENPTGEYYSTLRLECFSLLDSFESELRRFIESKLKLAYGDDWWERCIPKNIRDKAEKILEEEIKNGETVSKLDGLQFSHYEQIICDTQNWKVFQVIFGDKNVLMGHLRTIVEIRNRVAHNREITLDDKIKLLGSLVYIRTKLKGQKTLDNLLD